MKTSEDIRKQTTNRINRIRRMLRVLETSEFEHAWSSSTPEELKRIEGLIVLNQVNEVEKWIKSRQQITFDEMSVRELREEAKKFGIPYYGTLSKSSLLWELHNAVDRANEVGNGSVGGMVQTQPSGL